MVGSSRSDDQRYRLGEVLGRGAIATVFALEAEDGRRHAGKLLHDSQGQDPAAVARFIQEAALLRRLDHPNIVRVIETITLGGRPALVMELVDGPTLTRHIARAAPLAEADLLAIGRGIASGLAHAHAAGIIHRDLKPGNILLAGGLTPKITDFGMARAASFAGIEHLAMTVVGTPDYMAPESGDPLAVDLRSDLYALGCILFEMAVGRPPFSAVTPLGLLHQHRVAPIPAVPESMSQGTRALITELLAKSPGERPQAADAVARRLTELAEGAPGRCLARVDETGRTRCHGCNARLLPGLGLCLACGEATVALERGHHTVLVLGPGEVGDKLDTAARDRLCAWLRANPGLLLDVAPLATKIPRLPFTLCTRVDRHGAEAVAAALGHLGLVASARHGGPLGEPAMRKKARTLTLRVMAIIALSGGTWGGGKALFVLPFALAVAAFASIWTSVGATTWALPRPPTSLAPTLTAALGRVERVVPALVAARHRHALRAVVLRALDLAATHPRDKEAAAELAHAIDVATVAAGRLDALDRELEHLDIRSASDEVRARLHERDTWSARLLDLTATLDALQARHAGARHTLAAAGVDERLHELRIRVEALEEIARL